MLHLGQFHLQFAFRTFRALGKNIENEIGTVNHPHADDFFDIANLNRRELMIEHDEVCIRGNHARGDFVEPVRPVQHSTRAAGEDRLVEVDLVTLAVAVDDLHAGDAQVEHAVKERAIALCRRFPIYS